MAARLLRIEKAILRGAPLPIRVFALDFAFKIPWPWRFESACLTFTELRKKGPSGCSAGAVEETMRLIGSDRDESVKTKSSKVAVRLS